MKRSYEKTIRFILLGVFLVSGLHTDAQDKGSFVDSRDDHSYSWVKIGNQTWMAENLAYLPHVNRAVESQFEGKIYYVYDYDGKNVSDAKATANFEKFGVLYNWEAASESCPANWHLPSDEEWKTMEKSLGMSSEEVSGRGWRSSGEVGGKLKSDAGWSTNTGTDSFGFHALPGGCRGYGGFESMTFCGYFWTSSPAGGDNGWRRGFCGDDKGSNREEERRYFGLSVRCVKD